MTTIHHWTEPSRYLLCGELVGTETTSSRRQDVNCPACLDVFAEWDRGTVQRTTRRRQMVQAQGAIAADILWRRGWPLPDGQPPGDCDHLQFESSVDVDRLTDVDDGPVTGYSADIRIRCATCGLPFVFLGLPGGLSPLTPTTSLAGDELRAPLRPMRADIAAALAADDDR